MTWTLRIARPSSDPERLAALCIIGLRFVRLGASPVTPASMA